mgnify:CR=1 FL=1|jgi:hypothetical protein
MTTGARPPSPLDPGPTMRGIWVAIFAVCFAIALYLAVAGRGSPWPPVIFGALTALFILEPYLLAWQLRRRREILQITDWGIRRILPGGKSEAITWQALSEVWVVTTDTGPFAEDVYFLLVASDATGVAVPNSLALKNDLLAYLQKLPAFDNQRLVEAMGSTGNARFLVWRVATLTSQMASQDNANPGTSS